MVIDFSPPSCALGTPPSALPPPGYFVKPKKKPSPHTGGWRQSVRRNPDSQTFEFGYRFHQGGLRQINSSAPRCLFPTPSFPGKLVNKWLNGNRPPRSLHTKETPFVRISPHWIVSFFHPGDHVIISVHFRQFLTGALLLALVANAISPLKYSSLQRNPFPSSCFAEELGFCSSSSHL